MDFNHCEFFCPSNLLSKDSFWHRILKIYVHHGSCTLQSVDLSIIRPIVGKEVLYSTTNRILLVLQLFSTVLPAKRDSDVMFGLQSYLGLRIDISLVY